ncbi:MAG: hypothetical protein E7J62_06120 [Serratia marcescens]|nr:hypothetical protein [Serratia marcescens]MDU7804204.1 hypothetical protein [Serratia marcescens]
MTFSNDFLKILGAWQKGWKEDQTVRLELAQRLRSASLALPSQFKQVDQPCYRKHFLRKGELFEIIMVDGKDDDLTSWTICQKYAENFKGLHKPGAVSAAIF